MHKPRQRKTRLAFLETRRNAHRSIFSHFCTEIMEPVDISSATIADLPEILALQKCAFQSEGALTGDFSIQPLTQTFDELKAEFARGFALKAILTNNPSKIIGSIRGHISDDALHVGKLIVHPDFQNQGLGARLLSEIERFHPHSCYALFTAALNLKNQALYKKQGYREIGRRPFDGLEMVFFEKRA